ncbi:uncharacterized protein LOC118191335 [Stegodyphus dumicola]|uniref:uncharacterized protein LOC118191335 n=1 Tax=Stegodyphus dumicola TaxID=202533 RepID=UPI0015A7E75D|nr:uncharacterized protein LOC118191335 [Stegodyphus dumicola]
MLQAKGVSFKVHKAILWARWTKLAEKLEEEDTYKQILDTQPDVLSSIIQYIYTGSMDFSMSESLELYHVMEKYEIPSRRFLPFTAQKANTRINVEEISFRWPIETFDAIPSYTNLYSHVFTVRSISSCKWNMILHISPKRRIEISLCKIDNNDSQPIFVASKITFLRDFLSESDSGITLIPNVHLFQTDKKWRCFEDYPILWGNSFLLECEFKFANYHYSSEIVKSSCEIMSSMKCPNYINDLQNLYRSAKLSDITIIVGSKTFPAHKFILCARSSVFSRMLQIKMSESTSSTVVISDVKPDIMDELLLFMYSEKLEKPLEATAMQLYAAADKYDIPALKEKCSSFLKSNFHVRNVCKVLHLADMHSDSDLYNSALVFFSAHTQQVFLTDEWKEISKENLWFKHLEKVIFLKSQEKESTTSCKDINSTYYKMRICRASFCYEELLTVLCDCERIVNSRPLTYVSDDIEDPLPLTPEKFLHETPQSGVPDIDNVDKVKLSRRAKYLQRMRELLRNKNMAHRMEVRTESKFEFKWLIENLSMCHESKEEYFYSPEFALNTLPGMKWRVQLYPKKSFHENHAAIYLTRNNFSQTCKVIFRFQVLDCCGTLIYNFNERTSVFGAKNKWGYDHSNERFLFRTFKNDILVIKCSLRPVCEPKSRKMLPGLSYENGLFSDVVLRAGDSAFKVHKAILWARWPKMAEKLDAEETSQQVLDIGSNVLEVIIRYVYAGKIDFSEYDLFEEELSAAALKYEIPNFPLVAIEAQTVRTHINVEKILLKWPIRNFSKLPVNTVLRSRAFNCHLVRSCRWNLIFNKYKDEEGGSVIVDVSVCRVYDDEYEPVFLRTKISYDVTHSRETEHLFEYDDKWKCAQFSRISVSAEDILVLQCEFQFSSCVYSSDIVETSCEFTPILNCHYFISDLLNLYKSGKLSDIRIVVGEKTFSAHKFVLSARSPVFSRMFASEMIESKNSIVEISDVDADTIDKMLFFMYSGVLEKLPEATTMQLYTIADKYDIPVLTEICSSFLKSDFTIKNVCEILQLAGVHSDRDLYKSALAYFTAHAKEVFSTDEWKKLSEINFWAKLLENVVTQS